MLKDKDLREPLFDFLEANFGKNRIIEEKQIGKTRADVVMITEDKFYGIEIKSDADTYTRLERQVRDYNRIFDYNIVAVGASHAKHVEEHLPDYWGVLVLEDTGESVDIYWQRDPLPNPKREKRVKFRNQICFLWRAELAQILAENGFPKYASKGRQKIAEYLIDKMDEDELKRKVCDLLMERDYTIYDSKEE